MNFYQRSLTVEAWVYPLTVSLSSDAIIYAQIQSATFGHYMLMMLRNGRNYAAFFANDVTGPTVLQANRWYHMAFTYDMSTTTQTVYINGVAGNETEKKTSCMNHPLSLPSHCRWGESKCSSLSDHVWFASHRSISRWQWLIRRLHRSIADSFQSCQISFGDPR